MKKIFYFIYFIMIYFKFFGQVQIQDSNAVLQSKLSIPFNIYNIDKILNIKNNLNIETNYFYTLNNKSIDISDIFILNSNFITQSENSVFISPINSGTILNSNNSSDWNPITSLNGVSKFTSLNGGFLWSGNIPLLFSCDPSVVIDISGRMYIGFVSSNFGQDISYSDDNGSTWINIDVADLIWPQHTGEVLDKNHLWVDNNLLSLYQGRLYSAWTAFDIENPNNKNIELSYSTNGGTLWSNPQNISSNVNAGSHNQGVNIQTGPNGEVYTCWAIYDAFTFFNFSEVGIGFSKSLDGGVNWTSAYRIINNIRGIRTKPGIVCTDVIICGNTTDCHIHPSLGGGKFMRTNSFPSMTVNQQTGEIYIVWTNIGVPAINTGDADIYLIKSSDQGNNWSIPVRVNQDQINNSKDQWFPWVACDEVTGALVVIYYDSRDFINNDGANTYVSISYDGGDTWIDNLISDVSWDANPIEGICVPPQSKFAVGYAGDYIGIDFSNGLIVPVWSDDRTGNMLAYTQPFYIPCLPDLVLNNDIISSSLSYKFRDNIIIPSGVNYSITSTGKLELQANTEIVIEGEFVSEGEFYAHIVPCDNNGFKNLSNNTNEINKPDFQASLLIHSFECKVFPNPAENFLKINSEYDGTLYIRDIFGKTVKEIQVFAGYNILEISDVSAGILFLEMKGRSLNKYFKVVKL